MKGRAVIMASARSGGSDGWQTPDRVLEVVRAIGPISLDPCTTRGNPTRANHYYYKNGLNRYWYDSAIGGVTFINPPYSDVANWIGKAIAEYSDSKRALEIVTLTAARTDRNWFQALLRLAGVVCFIHGRLRFKDARFDAPFPSALFYLGPHPERAAAAFTLFGCVIPLNHYKRVVKNRKAKL
jgi:phage N-6-adenine-methyltransferase